MLSMGDPIMRRPNCRAWDQTPSRSQSSNNFKTREPKIHSVLADQDDHKILSGLFFGSLVSIHPRCRMDLILIYMFR